MNIELDENNTICKKSKLIDLVNMINKLQLNSFVKAVEVIQEGSISLDFVHQKTIEVLCSDNACYLPAHAFLLGEIIADAESLIHHLLLFLERRFEKLNFRMALLTELNSDCPIAYFITINEGIVSGFLVKMKNE